MKNGAVRSTKPQKAARPVRKTHPFARAQDLSDLLLIAETATQSLDIDKILNDTLNKALEILGFDVGFIRTLDREGKNMLVRAARGLRSPEFLAGVAPVDNERRNVSRLVFESKEPYVCTDIRKNPIYQNRSMEREGVISTAAAPIISKQRVLGIMVVGSRKQHKFRQREVNLLKAFGAQLGTALENAELYQEVNNGKAYIENLMENAADVIVSTDLNDRILTWNRGAEIIFGYGKQEMIGQDLSILLPAERVHELSEMRAQVAISGALRDIEVRSKKKDGVIIDLSLSVSPIANIDGQTVGFLRVAKDITEKKRYEQRLKDLDKLKSDFVSSVSHELRTPLTAIKGSVDNMLDGITGPLNEKQTRYLIRVKSNADRLARLINDLLDLSRIEAGISLKPANISVSAIAKEVAESLRPVAAEKLIDIAVESPVEAAAAWADPDRLAQIFMNLVGNAIKFSPANGKVTISFEQDHRWIKVSVADTGAGIAADQADKIFDKFYQITQAEKPKAKGTGLGLSIAKALVEMHGGKIWLESEPTGGTTFSFTLPAKQPQ
jgi:PAS domain S-box-containing protein